VEFFVVKSIRLFLGTNKILQTLPQHLQAGHDALNFIQTDREESTFPGLVWL
jgi:hypothetical protein